MKNRLYRLPRTERDKIKYRRTDIAVMRAQMFRVLLKCRKHYSWNKARKLKRTALKQYLHIQPHIAYFTYFNYLSHPFKIDLRPFITR